jgi:hypothetical protein
VLVGTGVHERDFWLFAERLGTRLLVDRRPIFWRRHPGGLEQGHAEVPVRLASLCKRYRSTTTKRVASLLISCPKDGCGV